MTDPQRQGLMRQLAFGIAATAVITLVVALQPVDMSRWFYVAMGAAVTYGVVMLLLVWRKVGPFRDR